MSQKDQPNFSYHIIWIIINYAWVPIFNSRSKVGIINVMFFCLFVLNKGETVTSFVHRYVILSYTGQRYIAHALKVFLTQSSDYLLDS